MKRGDLLITRYSGFTIEYSLTGGEISVTKRCRSASDVTVKIRTEYTDDKARILCAMLWACRATPLTALEMAEEFEL